MRLISPSWRCGSKRPPVGFTRFFWVSRLIDFFCTGGEIRSLIWIDHPFLYILCWTLFSLGTLMKMYMLYVSWLLTRIKTLLIKLLGTLRPQRISTTHRQKNLSFIASESCLDTASSQRFGEQGSSLRLHVMRLLIVPAGGWASPRLCPPAVAVRYC